MYVRKRELPNTFPPNYRGNLSLNEICEENHIESTKTSHTYKLRKNTYCTKKKKEKHEIPFDSFSGDELLLLGVLVFLYVGCEHSKENLILIGAIAYLLFT